MVRRNLKPSIHRAADSIDAEQLPVFVAGRLCADDTPFQKLFRVNASYRVLQGQVIRSVFLAADSAFQRIRKRTIAKIAHGSHIFIV